MERVSVVGTSGSGKTTFARRLAAAMRVEHVELDALHWGPGWTSASAESLSESVREATASDAWVVDGNYQGKLGDQVWRLADTVVWLDPSRPRLMWQVVTRTARRAALRAPLWNGNTETWGGFAVWRGPEDSIVAWAWSTFSANRARYEQAMRDPSNSHLTFRRLRTRREVERFIAEARPVPGADGRGRAR